MFYISSLSIGIVAAIMLIHGAMKVILLECVMFCIIT